jgi:hypothetical protein
LPTSTKSPEILGIPYGTAYVGLNRIAINCLYSFPSEAKQSNASAENGN